MLLPLSKQVPGDGRGSFASLEAFAHRHSTQDRVEIRWEQTSVTQFAGIPGLTRPQPRGQPDVAAYLARRTAEGKTKAEIIRCLKRLLAREVWAHLRPLRQARTTSNSPLDSYRSNNALMETINGLYKAECIRSTVFHDGPYKTVADVEYATAGWVDWYNNRRLHSTLGNVPPIEYEQAHYAALNREPQPV